MERQSITFVFPRWTVHKNSPVSWSIVAIILVVTLGACSNAGIPNGGSYGGIGNRITELQSISVQPRVQPAQIRASSRYAYTGPLLFVPNVGPDTVQVYPVKRKNPRPIATITDGLDYPEDACIDTKGHLYVVNAPISGAGWVSIYGAGQTKPFQIVTTGINGPAACAIDARGNLWVTNFNGGNVTEYLRGAKKPHYIITSGLVSPNGIAIDHSGNIYVANGPSHYIQDNVQVYSPGTKSPKQTITDGVTSPVGIAVDAGGTLYVTNEFQNNIEEYRSGASEPYQTITEEMDGPAGVTVNRDGRLYVSNWENAVVVEFARGSITPSKREITKDLYTPSGPAYSPPLLP